MFLAGDIGGTRARLYAVEHGKIAVEKTYVSKEFSNLSAILDQFLKDTNLSIDSAVLGIAGPVVDEHCKTPNLPWDVSVADLKKTLCIEELHLVNDLVLLSLGLHGVDPSFLQKIQEGKKRKGPRLVGCPGTGLGIACILHQKPHWDVLATESGHVDFAPSNAHEIRLLEHFLKTMDHVSVEKLISGPGLYRLYEYESLLKNQPLLWKTSEEITDKAVLERDPFALHVCQLFLDLFAACLGNFALNYMAYDGVYLVGALIRKLAPLIDSKRFSQRFSSKGRLESFLKTFPIYIVSEAKTAVRGASLYLKTARESLYDV